MIQIGFGGNLEGEIGALMKRFDALPRYIAKKHLKAVMKRAGKTAVPVLKSNTPVGRGTLTPNGRRSGSGGLRRAATVKSYQKGKNKEAVIIGVLGYRYGWESRKAIWLEYGTSRGIEPRQMVGKTMASWSGPTKEVLTSEMRKALAAAVKEAKAGINPGVGKSGFGPGRGG